MALDADNSIHDSDVDDQTEAAPSDFITSPSVLASEASVRFATDNALQGPQVVISSQRNTGDKRGAGGNATDDTGSSSAMPSKKQKKSNIALTKK